MDLPTCNTCNVKIFKKEIHSSCNKHGRDCMRKKCDLSYYIYACNCETVNQNFKYDCPCLYEISVSSIVLVKKCDRHFQNEINLAIKIRYEIEHEILEKYEDTFSGQYCLILSQIETKSYTRLKNLIDKFRYSVAVNAAATIGKYKYCYGYGYSDAYLKRILLKNYSTVLDCKKISNKWMVSKEKLNYFEFLYWRVPTSILPIL